MFFPFVQRLWWTCIPLALSPKIGFGMNVAIMPILWATIFITYR